LTREEFVSKFNVGDKIVLPHWHENHYAVVLYAGQKSVFFRKYYQGSIREFSTSFGDCFSWLPYTEPIPQWDWNEDVQFAKKNSNLRVYAIIKLSNMLYYTIDIDSYVIMILRNKIEQYYKPCLRPDNWQDYGVGE